MDSLLLMLSGVGWAAVLCAYDLKYRRLPNAVTLGGTAGFLAFHLGLYGMEGLISGFAASVIAGGFLLVPWLVRAAGGGDVKMLAGAGAAVGAGSVLTLLLITSIAGLVVALSWLAAGSVNPVRLRHGFRCLADPRYDRKAGRASLPNRDSQTVRVPFSLAIALGLVGSFLTLP